MMIPAEHVEWLRKTVKETMASDADCFPSSDAVSREDAVGVQEKSALYIALLDQLGWSDDDGDGSKEITLDGGFVRPLLKEEIEGLGEAMLVATGHYESETFELAEVRLVGRRAAWLVSTLEEFGAEEVAA